MLRASVQSILGSTLCKQRLRLETLRRDAATKLARGAARALRERQSVWPALRIAAARNALAGRRRPRTVLCRCSSAPPLERGTLDEDRTAHGPQRGGWLQSACAWRSALLPLRRRGSVAVIIGSALSPTEGVGANQRAEF